MRGSAASGSLVARDAGATLVELLTVLTLATCVLAFSIPVTGASLDANRGRTAARFVATELRLARQQAVTRSAEVALVFSLEDARWVFRAYVDGNRNGVRRADITKSKDLCIEGPYDVAAMFPGVAVASDPSIPDPDGGAGSADPIRFGSADMASFSSLGSGTSGSFYLRSSLGVQFVVRVAGVTGRTRVLWFDDAARLWREL